ncbi:hypothetical protein [Shinella kummerowiae]|uniref:hypothetical protein n=1 Tax=Shinella kummerowiae TaxID=417745 RepID=UPI0021B55729|nr:hypothetical protein [Shinella kummerowiae]MCT7663872.1 hypothetical protein [Shinella kummerowiae]
MPAYIETVATRTALKALDTTSIKAALLMEGTVAGNGRMGTFVWKDGNYSTQIAADPQEGLFIEAADEANNRTHGAWVRQFEGEPHIGMWGATTSAADNKAAIEAAINCVAAIYPTRAKTLRIPQGVYKFSSISIPAAATGFSLVGENFWNCNLHCTDLTGTPAISVLCQEFKMIGIGLYSDVDYQDSTLQKTGIKLDKGTSKPLDVDAVISECRINTFWNAVDHNGRGLIFRDNIVSQVQYGVNLRWPALADFQPNWIDIDSVTVSRSGNVINAITPPADVPGTFKYPPTIYIREGGGSGATATAVLTGNEITGFTVTNGGSGYTSTPIISRIEPVQAHDGGWRGIIIVNNRFHTLNYAAIANIGPNRHLLNGLVATDNLLDIGRRLYYGHLGTGALIDGGVVQETRTEILELTGGTNFIVSNITGGGTGPNEELTPKNLVKLSGVFHGGRFSNFALANSERDAVTAVASSQLLGVTFDGFTFDGIGFVTPASYSCFDFDSANSDIEILNAKLIATANRESFARNKQETNAVRLVNPTRVGANTTPYFSGSAASAENCTVDRPRSYNPVFTYNTNVASATASSMDWVPVGDHMIQVSGRIIAQASAAGSAILEISLPKTSNFTDQNQAAGSFICATTGKNVAGAVLANVANDRFEVRWTAPDTLSVSFSFSAIYRVA